MNDLYIGIENPLKAVAENIRCKDLVLSTDNGQVSGKNCDYIIKPNHVGEANLYLFQKTKKDSILIGTSRFRVRYLPNPVARIANKKGGFIRKEILQVQSAIIVILENMDINIHYGIKGYTVTILRDNIALYTEDVSDRFLSNTIKDKFSELKSTDVVFFSNIQAIWPGGKVDTIDPVILKIE